MNAPDVAFQVARQFHALRRRYLTVRVATALLIAVAVLMVAWIVAAVVDYRWERALSHRTAGMFIVVTSVVGWLLWRLTHDIQSIRGRRFAGVLERAYSDFGQRIRTVLDTTDGRVTGPPEMLGALGHQTLGRWELCTPGRIVPMRGLIATGIAALLGLVVSIVMLGLGGEWQTAMLRSIGWDTPYTQLKVTPGDAKILEGNAVVVAVELIGRNDRDVVLRYREIRPEGSNEGNSDWIESELVGGESEEQRAHRKTKLGKAIWPIEYQFICRQQTTPVYRIDIQPLIKTKRIEVQVVAPEYTGLQPRTFPTANVSVLERSTVHATIELNHPLGEASLLVGPKRSQMKPVTLTPGEDRNVWSFDLPAERTVRWIFSGSGADGTPMEPVNGRMGVRRDGAPSIRWREPADAIKVHTLAEVPLTAQIGDDYGIAETGIAFQLGGEEEFVLIDWAPEEDAASDPSLAKTRLELSEVLPLESFALSERDYIAYYAYAIDNRPWGQQRVESEVRYIDIRPLRQFYQEIDPPAGNGGGGRVIVQLGEIIRRQRFVINRTRKLLRGNESTDSQLQTIDRLFKTESELADLTRFLAEFFLSRGNDDVEALSQAESSMLQAADSMAAGSLDLSMAQQQDSLRSLAEARRTLEIALLKRMTAAQQRALRRLATQMRQKLRRDRPITEQAIADSIRKIAMEERRLAIVAQKAASATPSEQANPQAGGSDSAMAPENTEQVETAEQNENAEQVETDEELDKTKADEDSGEKQDSLGETLYQQQTELLERLEAISTELTDRLSQSPLLASRMEQTQADMDALAGQMADGQMEQIASQASVLSERLDEIGLQLAALAVSEPVTRVSSLRDLTNGLASMESDVAEQMMRDEESEQQSSSLGSEPLGRLSQRAVARSQTIRDVMQHQAEVGDIEMSEVNDQLQSMAKEIEFPEQLEQTEEALDGIAQQKSRTEQQTSTASMQRSQEYIEAARALDRLYQQLVTPRLARLRKMEQQASQLAKQMSGQGGGGRQQENEKELRELKAALSSVGLEDLAEQLEAEQLEADESDEEPKNSGEEEADERENESGSGDKDQADQEGQMASSSTEDPLDITSEKRGSGGFASFPRSQVGKRVQQVADELRKRIQQVILLEIAADRDTPIPSQYRNAVDGYFKTLATMGQGTEEGSQ